jgi:hypothetical protein
MNRSSFAAGLFIMGASIFCYGQKPIAEATVPFDFHMGQTMLPAGNYTVSESRTLLLLRGESGKPSAMLLTLPTERHRKASTPSLEFERYGNEYFLKDIWYSNSQEGRALPTSKQQQELARRAAFKTTEEVALRTTNRSARDDK